MNWQIVIGLETHVQLQTRSKIFSGASTHFGAPPNAQACAIDIALPGVLPVLNKRAVEYAIRFGLAVNGRIAPRSIFARKHYFYPDLPKAYQISQYELPVVSGGALNYPLEGMTKTVRLTRAHLEEDAGKSLHEDFVGQSGIDLNRAGTPLLEIVTEPDMTSAAEAVAYARALHALVMWIGICDGNLQEGSFRCDANVSVRRLGAPLGTRREIKNLNSFRFLQQAIDSEARWQINELEDGRAIRQATVLFDPDSGETRAMRSKEDAQDYRYFPDPDLLPLEIFPAWIDEIRAALPELPALMRARFVADYGLSDYAAAAVTADLATARYFEEAARVAAGATQAKLIANWLMGEIAARLNKEERTIAACPVSAPQLAALVRRIADNTLSNKLAREVFEALWSGEGDAGEAAVDALIKARNLTQTSDTGAIAAWVQEVIASNPHSVAEYRAGKDKAFNALVGQVMKRAAGRANPREVNEVLKAALQ